MLGVSLKISRLLIYLLYFYYVSDATQVLFKPQLSDTRYDA